MNDGREIVRVLLQGVMIPRAANMWILLHIGPATYIKVELTASKNILLNAKVMTHNHISIDDIFSPNCIGLSDVPV